MKHIKLVLLCALLALPSAAVTAEADDELGERLRAAERRLEEAARELADLNLRMHGDDIEHIFRFVQGNAAGRAMLGINIGHIEKRFAGGDDTAGAKSPDGVTVLGVTPGGPAADAGLQAGDVILELDGEPLTGHDGTPLHRLLELMSDVQAGQTVRLRYRRGEDLRDADVVTEAFGVYPRALGDGHDFDFEVFSHDMERLAERLPFLPHLAQHAWRGLELVELNADLGRYFGTDQGLLVVRAPATADLALRAGDVVQTIGGATPKSVPDAMRLLHFYQPGDTLVVEVMRDKRGKTLEIVVPKRGA